MDRRSIGYTHKAQTLRITTSTGAGNCSREGARAVADADAESFAHLAYWRLASGIEVDFVVDDVRLAIEAKATAKVTADHLRGLRALAQDHPRVERRIVVCLEARSRRTEDGIEVLPVREFCARLAAGDLS